MEKFNEHVLPFLEGGCIRYQHNGEAKAMSADYFRRNFRNVAATELPHIGQRSFYYQSVQDPDLVLRFRLSQTTGLSAVLMLHSDFEKQLKALGRL
ncbi:hypothetical protein ACFS7Z_20875 [Pontibacter toksunensis]|uniref:Uncharacterized protein n=1 Tax=Pontibacter toksunensis TaxID=1332631 RepID=A0ABW6BYE5_9BACT